MQLMVDWGDNVYKVHVYMNCCFLYFLFNLEQNAGLLQRIDSDVASKIKEIVVEDGVANVEEMQRHLTSFVTKNVTPALSKTNRRFAPTKKVIRYHMNKAAKKGCDSSDDQHNLVQLVSVLSV
ncbi:hypothetical protein DPMN_069816 [Dreissena polymorpha]|uniref:Uncharacterized protein n=1 Tax=Dreissena polymorpha TaxID=45954 RepID=A0A9D3Z522_DREPO|nr:hypothetical protein DPMN_069816 [Dreissena polymorpha]